jgi:pimeloyl-ACP methyl ester carboxylesterase
MRVFREGAAFVAGALSLALATAAPAQVPTSGPQDASLADYAKAKVMADVGGGRRIHLFCTGAGSPTVILTAGLGNWSETWRKIQPAISRKVRVCAWDRAGSGYSSPSSEPQDVRHTTADLEKALSAANIRPPYVLVGHSLGGYESLIFADHHPHDVVGMVLVDPSIPNQQQILAGYIGPEYAAINREYNTRFTSFLTECETGLKARMLKPGSDPRGCLNLPREYPEDLKAALLPIQMDPAKYATMKSLVENVDADGALVVNASRSYGRMPLIVLSAGSSPGLPPELHASAAAVQGFEKYQSVGWRDAHEKLAALSTKGQHRVVEGSGHNIQLLKPEAVIEAVDQVLDHPSGASARN